MANINAPFGLRPTGRNKSGGNVELKPYLKAASDAVAMYQWDALTVDINNRVTATITPGTSYFAGVAMQYLPASVLNTVNVLDQFDAVYEIQTDGSATFAEASGIGMNANISVATAGSAATKISGQALSTTSLAVTATFDLKVIDKAREATGNSTTSVAGVVYGSQAGNDFGLYAKVLVVFNKFRGMAGAQVLGI